MVGRTIPFWLAVIFVSATITAPIRASEGWTLEKEENGIRVWTREQEGRAIRAHRIEAVIDAPLDRVRQVLLDFDGYAAWSRDITASRTVESHPDGAFVIHAMTDLPFPVWDRDIVQRGTIREEANGSVIVELRAAPDAIPENDSVVRIRDARSSWRLERLEAERTRVVEEGHADPSGSVPSFVTNLFVVEGPFRTMQDLQGRLAE